jgi:hypothetical protein
MATEAHGDPTACQVKMAHLEPLEKRETQANQVLRVEMALLVILEKMERVDPLVIRVPKETLDLHVRHFIIVRWMNSK